LGECFDSIRTARFKNLKKIILSDEKTNEFDKDEIEDA